MGVQDDPLRVALVGTQADCGGKVGCAGDGQRFYPEAFFVVLPVYFGYASFFALQHDVKVRVGIRDDGSDYSLEFGLAVSFLYIFCLIFHSLHGVIFGFLSSKSRVLVAMAAMALAMMILAFPNMPEGTHGIHWVMFTYGLGGVAIGTFEPNFLTCVAALGERTKSKAILGIPVGISSLLIGGFLLMGPPFHVPVKTIYMAVACSLLCGMSLMALRLPANGCAGAPQPGLRRLAVDARQWRKWLPQTWSYPPVFMLDMFALSAFSPGVALYIYSGPTVELVPGVEIPTDSFFAAFNSCNMLGSLLGRWLSYRVRPRHPVVYAVLSAAGAAIMLLRVPVLVPLSTFLIMLGDGLIYGTTVRHIDSHVPEEFILVATSAWCFCGDIGAILGTNAISFFETLIIA